LQDGEGRQQRSMLQGAVLDLQRERDLARLHRRGGDCTKDPRTLILAGVLITAIVI
jgi:hypothetical protein